ncbi:MAG: hypothetical protein WBA74_03905 [Cyclobacteriaceae bacterium]
MKIAPAPIQTHQQELQKSGSGNNQYAGVKITNTYKTADPGAWIRIHQSDGTFRFVWNKTVTDQEDVDDIYTATATFMGKTLNVNATDGNDYLLDEDGTCRIYKKGLAANKVDVKTIIGKSMVPAYHSGTYDKRVHIANGVYENLKVEARFSVPNLSEEETKNLKWIQILYGPDKPHRPGLGAIKGKIAFVDGGINSAKGRKEPWYGNSKKVGYHTMNKSRETDGFKFTLSDFPGAIMRVKGQKAGQPFVLRTIGKDLPDYTQINFESYVVLPNYRNSGKIKILGVVKWGFNNNNWVITKTIPDPEMVPTDKFSAKAEEIWQNDYGSSSYKIY